MLCIFSYKKQVTFFILDSNIMAEAVNPIAVADCNGIKEHDLNGE